MRNVIFLQWRLFEQQQEFLDPLRSFFPDVGNKKDLWKLEQAD